MTESRAARLLGRPLTVGGLTVPNRIVMAPMTRQFSPGGVPGEDVAAYYARRAAGGVGLIVTEGTYVNRAAAPSGESVPHFYGTDALAGWAAVARAVHGQGGKIIPQLWHTGLMRRTDDPPAEGPSGISVSGKPRGTVMTQQDIDATVEAFADGAAAAERLGFDGVELHGAHGYLIDSFLWSGTNLRADAYGRDRARFATEIVRAIRSRVAPDFPVVLRLSQWKSGRYDARIADTPDELAALLTPLSDAGVDIFHASTRRYWLPEFDGSDLNLAGWVGKLTGRTTITVGSVGLDQEFVGPQGMNAESGAAGIDLLLDRLENAEFDLVAVGRALLADPEWARKALTGRLTDARPYTPDALATLL